MLRILVIVTLVGYVLYKLGLFRGLINHTIKGPGAGRDFKRPGEGNVNIDSVPDDNKNPTRHSRFKGGEYVDYEEIK